MAVEIRINGRRVGELPEEVRWNDVRAIDRLVRHNKDFLVKHVKEKVIGAAYYSPEGVDFECSASGNKSLSAKQGNELIRDRKY